MGGQRISFTPGGTSPTGSLVRLECLQPVQMTEGMVSVGTPCADDTMCNSATVPNLRCDVTTTRTCQIACNTDAECPGGFRCSPTALGGFSGTCINPTCTG
ncbi:MAG: hypothetical protein AAGF12_03130 [Myxococcota bacterium]